MENCPTSLVFPKSGIQCKKHLQCLYKITLICILLLVVFAFGEFVVVSRSESFGIYVVLGFSLKCNNSNSTLAVCSDFDLHRFLQVFGKKIEKDLACARI